MCAKIFEHGIVPPTTNLDNPDLEAGCDLDYTPNVAYTFPEGGRPRAIISDNLGFGKRWFVGDFVYVYVYTQYNILCI